LGTTLVQDKSARHEASLPGVVEPAAFGRTEQQADRGSPGPVRALNVKMALLAALLLAKGFAVRGR
jgi:hypothetical protein